MNELVKTPQGMPVPGTRDGNWVWDGCRWVCDSDCDNVFPPFGPPVFSGPTAQPPWYPGANGGISFGQVGNFPPNPTRGHLFFDGKNLWLFDGAAWVTVGVAGAAGGGGGGGATGAGTVTISVTPPGNPQTGSQWWDGSQLRMWDGSQWVVIGPGTATGPVPTTTITFTMTCSTQKALGSFWTIIPFSDQPQVDTQSAYDHITQRYKPVKAGMYQFACRGFPDGIAIVKNDTGNFQGGSTSDIVTAIATNPPNTNEWLQCSGITLMNGSTDFIRMWARSTQQIFPAAGPNPCLQAILLP